MFFHYIRGRRLEIKMDRARGPCGGADDQVVQADHLFMFHVAYSEHFV